MPASAATLIQRTRRFVRDYPDIDSTTASLSSSVTTVPVADTTVYKVGWIIDVDAEAMQVTALASGTNLTVRRGVRGSTAISHGTSATVLARPAFLSVEILDALNGAKDDAYPLVYAPVNDTSLVPDTVTWEFAVPNMPGTYGGDSIPIQYISKIELKIAGDLRYREIRDWTVKRASSPLIVFRRAPLSGSLRVHGFGQLPDLTSVTDTLNAAVPKHIERILPLGAASELLASGEAGRVRTIAGAVDDREQANRAGSSISLSNTLYGRWRAKVQAAPMPPMGPHVVSVF